MGHSIRSCIVGLTIAREFGLPAQSQQDLLYALLLKDCGCSGNASKTFHTLGSDDLKAKHAVKLTDWTRTSWETLHYALTHVAPGKPFLERGQALFQLALRQKANAREVTQIRCERGATLARLMGLSEKTADGIRNLDEHWDGSGNPIGLRRGAIPLFSRIMLLAQTLEVFFVEAGSDAAVEIAVRRSKRWFDPELIQAMLSLQKRRALFAGLDHPDPLAALLDNEPEARVILPNDERMDDICMAFANIVDSKSPFTVYHSIGVANAAVAIARTLGMLKERVVFLRHAALLHDLGKLGVSNAILEKPTKLDDAEWVAMRRHPELTWQILRDIPGFQELGEVAASHHEKLDGSGYFRGLSAEHLSVESRILAVADVFDALAAKRPYRDALPRETVLTILRKDAARTLDASCVEALDQSGTECDQTLVSLQNLQSQLLSYQPVYTPS